MDCSNDFSGVDAGVDAALCLGLWVSLTLRSDLRDCLAFALLALILNGSRLAKAGARWRDADRELTARLAKIPTPLP